MRGGPVGQGKRVESNDFCFEAPKDLCRNLANLASTDDANSLAKDIEADQTAQRSAIS